MDSETRIRLGAFLGVFVAMALWEVFAPRRPLAPGRSWRWPNNLGVAAFNAILLRVLMPGAAVAVAAAGELEHWGLFNNLPPAIERHLPRAAIVLLSVILLEVALNTTSMFNHSNVRIPLAADRALRWLLVTPDMHRVHHSVIRAETNSNFGFNLSWWDRTLGTYRAQPERGRLGMTIGLDQFRDLTALRLDRMLLQPWRGAAGAYPLGRE